MKSRRFVDSVLISAQSGRGGNGCVSFRREKNIAKGGPNGGDGGNGGHVILRGNRDEDSLTSLFFNPRQRAESGQHGKGKTLHGRNGSDLIIPVPTGTEVRLEETGELLGDVVEHGQDLRVARGGRGGLGNCHWKTSTHQAPLEHTDGGEGETVMLRLVLKTVADIGLVGFPNAGKSSLLAALTPAHPKIAPYPFTTIHPVMGTLVFDDYTTLRIADIPGLIAGAHEGRGLGHDFLRHIERATALIYVIDMAGVDGREPWDDYAALRDELGFHNKELLKRRSLVAANKMDLPGAADNLRKFAKKTRTKPIPISAVTGEGLDKFRKAVQALPRTAASTLGTQSVSFTRETP